MVQTRVVDVLLNDLMSEYCSPHRDVSSFLVQWIPIIPVVAAVVNKAKDHLIHQHEKKQVVVVYVYPVSPDKDSMVQVLNSKDVVISVQL